MTTETQTLKIKNLISLNMVSFESVRSMKETITKGRLENIMSAYQAGTQNELPAIQVAGTTGQVIDGRHRLFVAWLMGATTIQANVHWPW